MSETDRYGRLLRYVYVDGVFANAALVADGGVESVLTHRTQCSQGWFDYLTVHARAADLGAIPPTYSAPCR